MTGKQSSRPQRLTCRKVGVAEPWHAYFFPLESLPLRTESRPLLLEAMRELVAAIRSVNPLERTVWLLLDELHHDNAVREISRHAAIWNPGMGLGLRPEDPPPRYWTTDDLLERDYHAPVPALKHTVVLFDTDEAGAELACSLMSGTGGLLQTLHRAPLQQVCAEWYGEFQPTIEEEGLAAYPLYAPIFGLNSVVKRDASTLARWMGSVDVYLRESAEDKGVFLLSRESLDEAIESLGCFSAER